MKEKIKQRVLYILAIAMFVAVTGAIFVTVSIFGGAVMKLFGFEYDSVWSILLYFLIVGLLGFPLDMWTSGIPVILVRAGRINARAGILLRLILETVCSSIVMGVVDYFLNNVKASGTAIIIVSFLMALLELYLDIKNAFKE